MKQLYVVGKYLSEHELGAVWSFQGIFDTKKKAEDACIDINYFIGPVVLNEQIPDETIIWPDCYYPKGEE